MTPLTQTRWSSQLNQKAGDISRFQHRCPSEGVDSPVNISFVKPFSHSFISNPIGDHIPPRRPKASHAQQGDVELVP